ncbi:N-acetylmuramoyl-L-alanine amidase family protein [Phocicoccus pinnipedialis]|uniref:N-acetylmuramoyl-L-alanine amidase AmiC n=1 Tax=Phocicoccus pinnipedialis TaxID=110845 RepID=A0A6V7RGG0_9BACL|nr:N-acetylmuramoyl-L-alanine amidase [Jeotgalicoccus pinnipedialis]MBP1939209.1 N-acetylmuramoyl-L-alanine amidase [Jeotgalicoccus pinnipedialis]CAD2076301.1 N-acetylmuramoyl-L-alanine amidase AmiC precursor [Jeotgalicoccus pinnipedialis]
MDVLKLILKKFGEFLKYKKHLYVKPLFLLTVSVLFIITFVFIVKKYEPNDTYEPIKISFEKQSYNLEGKTIVLDPGHGGDDPGAPSIFGVNEAHIVYSVANKLREVLEDSGATVVITREENETVSLDNRKLEGDMFISIHSDAFESSEVSGFTTFYRYENQIEFAKTISESLDQYAFIANRGTQEMSYQVIWQLDYPATLIELGYLSNSVDDSLLNDPGYQERMVHGIAEGIDNYVNKKK